MSKKRFNLRNLIIGFVFIGVVLLTLLLTLGLHAKPWTTDAFTYWVKVVLLNNFLGVTAILIGLLTLLGYLILGRRFSESIIGAIKSAIGVLILSIGSGALISMSKPVFITIGKMGQNIIPIDTYLGQVSSETFLNTLGNGFASWLSYALIIGLLINILLVALRRWTNVHSVMITGHVMFQQAAVVVPTIYLFIFSSTLTSTGLPIGSQIGTILISGIFLGVYWGVASSATIKGSDVVTQNAGFAVGHQQMFGVAIAYKIGKYFGKAEDSAETKKISNKFKIFEDNIFVQTILITLLFITLILIVKFAGSGFEPNDAKTGFASWKVAGGAHWTINLLLGSLKLVGSILVIQFGVRMFVTELQQSFQGISEKLVPGAVVAVDVAATYGFSPNSVTYGFLTGVIGQFLGVGLVIGLSQINGLPITIVMPLFITLFFNSGSIGVFANASGGYKASLAIPAIFGFFEIIILAFGLGIFAKFQVDTLNPFQTGYNGLFDWTFLYGSLMIISSYHDVLATIVIPVTIIGMLVLAQIVDSNRQKKPTLLQKVLKLKPSLISHE